MPLLDQNTIIDLPGVVATSYSRLPKYTPSRDITVCSMIELLLDKLYLSVYFSRYGFSEKARTLATPTLAAIDRTIRRFTYDINLVQSEIDTISNLEELTRFFISITGTNRLSGPKVPRIITNANTIIDLFDRLDLPTSTMETLHAKILFILSLADQVSYSTSNLVIPYIRLYDLAVGSNELASYLSVVIKLRIGYSYDRQNKPTDPDRFAQLIRCLILRPEELGDIVKLAKAIDIGFCPDAKTGLGIRYLPVERVLSSNRARKFLGYTNTDELAAYLKSLLVDNNPWMYNLNDTIQRTGPQAALAELDDTADKGEIGDDPDTGASDTEAKDDESEETSEDTTQDDPSTGGEGTTTDSAGTDGENKVDDTKQGLLGLNLTLVKSDESLDDFLYKLAIARFISNVIKFNHDDLPLETVATLAEWKASFLFLTQAEDTVKLLKDLGIKLKL